MTYISGTLAPPPLKNTSVSTLWCVKHESNVQPHKCLMCRPLYSVTCLPADTKHVAESKVWLNPQVKQLQ